MKTEIITLDDLITASGTYPERRNSPELTTEILINLSELKTKVNLLLKRLGVKSAKISSGFRPSKINSSISNAAAKSAHMTGEACDILDDSNQSLTLSINKVLLEEFELYREDSDFTKGKYTNWCHLQTRPTKSGNRIFKP